MADLTTMLGGFIQWPVGMATKGLLIDAGQADVKKGAILMYNTGDSYSVQHGVDGASSKFAGIALEDGAAGDTIQVATEGIFGPYTHGVGSLGDDDIGVPVCFGADDNHVTSAANAVYDKYVGVIYSAPSATTCMVRVGLDIVGLLDYAASGGGLTASEIPIADSGNLFTTDDVESALAQAQTAVDAIEAKNGLSYATANRKIATITRNAGAPTAGVYTVDCSATFSALTDIIGAPVITTAAGTLSNCQFITAVAISGTDVTITAKKSDGTTAADDASIVFKVTVIGTAV